MILIESFLLIGFKYIIDVSLVLLSVQCKKKQLNLINSSGQHYLNIFSFFIKSKYLYLQFNKFHHNVHCMIIQKMINSSLAQKTSKWSSCIQNPPKRQLNDLSPCWCAKMRWFPRDNLKLLDGNQSEISHGTVTTGFTKYQYID